MLVKCFNAKKLEIHIFVLENQVQGQVSYNGCRFDEFEPRKTSAYVSQNDVHLGDLTVKETFDYSAWFQGVGHRYGNKS